MIIKGLENNYYLSQNDIWISVGGFTEPVAFLDLTVTNTTTAAELPPFRLYPSPDNNFSFNICVPIRALYPESNHLQNNALQSFSFKFTATFANTETPADEITLPKYFIRGKLRQNNNSEWFLSDGDYLIVGKWLNYPHFILPSGANHINGNQIGTRNPAVQHCINVRCAADSKLLKFRNSLGGYQFFAFEKWEIKNKIRPGKIIPKTTQRLRMDNFRNTEAEETEVIEFYTKSSIEIQEIFTDLSRSPEVYLYHPEGTDDDAKWELMKKDNSESIHNNYDQVFENKITFERQ